MGSNPTGDNLFILFCVTLNLSDNLTEKYIMKKSIDPLQYGFLFLQKALNIAD